MSALRPDSREPSLRWESWYLHTGVTPRGRVSEGAWIVACRLGALSGARRTHESGWDEISAPRAASLRGRGMRCALALARVGYVGPRSNSRRAVVKTIGSRICPVESVRPRRVLESASGTGPLEESMTCPPTRGCAIWHPVP